MLILLIYAFKTFTTNALENVCKNTTIISIGEASELEDRDRDKKYEFK